ncbi:MAG: hypothetical protein K6E86_09280 [Bacteroidales bacterium]|nr:hypothetical protein [Bacteroidales bacterium]
MKKLFTLLFSMALLIQAAMAEEVTYDFSTSIPQGWTSSAKPAGFEQTSNKRGCQFTQSTTLTLKGSTGISKVEILCSCNIDSKNTIAVTVDGKTFGKLETLAKEANVTKTFEGTATDGDLNISLTRNSKSIYIKQIKVTCASHTENGEGQGGDNGQDEALNQLDANYQYPDSVIIRPSGTAAFNQAYSILQGNVLVRGTGTQSAEYFACAAGNSLQIDATQPFVAISINGSVKKNFTADADNGEISYAYDSENEVKQDPVVFVNNINAKSLKLTCTAQLRCEEIIIYFKQAPDLDLDNLFGEDEEELTFDYEPTEITTLSLSYDTMYYFSDLVPIDGSDNTLPLTDMYMEKDDHFTYISFIAEANIGTGVAPGIYPISYSCEPGTVVASIGGNDTEDYPSYVLTDIINYDDGTSAFNPYYLVSGTVTVSAQGSGLRIEVNAKSYNGSTINVLCQGIAIDSNAASAITDIVTEPDNSRRVKVMSNGHIHVVQGQSKYDLLGRKIK